MVVTKANCNSEPSTGFNRDKDLIVIYFTGYALLSWFWVLVSRLDPYHDKIQYEESDMNGNKYSDKDKNKYVIGSDNNGCIHVSR